MAAPGSVAEAVRGPAGDPPVFRNSVTVLRDLDDPLDDEPT
jgi:hypothetical protein